MIHSLSASSATAERPEGESIQILCASNCTDIDLGFKISKTLFQEDPAHIKYTVQPVGLASADVQGITADIDFVPSPIVLASAKWNFGLGTNSTLR